jgi:hypothetical protein
VLHHLPELIPVQGNGGTDGKFPQQEPADGAALQPENPITENRRHSADFPLQSLIQGHGNPRAPSASDGAHDPGNDKPLFQVDPLAPLVEVILRKGLVEADFIGLCDTPAWVKDLLSEITVIREKKEPLAVLVEATDRIRSLLPLKRGKKLHDGTVKPIRHGADKTSWLVEHQVEGLPRTHPLPVKSDDIARADPIGRGKGRPAVNPDSAGEDHGLRLPP